MSFSLSSPLSLDNKFAEELTRLRKEKPLIHNITNFVVMNTTANALLAIGASPIMAHESEELAELINYASAVVINIGTLDHDWILSMEQALQLAHKKKIPIILDPVGAGASTLRLQTCKKLLPYTTLLKGNLSELLALSAYPLSEISKISEASETSERPKNQQSQKSHGKGVDSEKIEKSSHNSTTIEECLQQIKNLQKIYPSLTICCSGETDYIFSPDGEWQIKNGHPMMEAVTGTGCTLSALCGAYAAILPTKQGIAALLGALSLGIAGEMAFEQTQGRGPGSLQVGIIDALYQLTPKDLITKSKIYCYQFTFQVNGAV